MTVIINQKYPLEQTLDWEVQEKPVFDQNGNEIPNYKQLVNSKTQTTIQICKDSYTPTRNERLQSICEKLTQNSSFELQGFATYKNGSKVMAYLQNENPKNFGSLPAKDYLLVGNSHDGSTSFFTGFTNYIYQCQNMFSAVNQQHRIRHTLNHEQELQALEQTYDLYYNHLTGVYEIADRLTDVPINDEIQGRFMQKVLDLPPKHEWSTRRENIVNQVVTSILEETSALGNNLFGLFNGITHYTSNILNQRKPVFGNPFNLANTLNQRAYQFCKVELEKAPKKIQVAMPKPVNAF